MKSAIVINLMYILPLFISFLLSLFFTRSLIKILPLLKIIDTPNEERKIHSNPVPTAGGIGIILALVIAISIYYFSSVFLIGGSLISFTILGKILIPCLIIISGGLIDDIYKLTPLLKLLLQISAASLCWFSGIEISMFLGFHLSSYISYCLTLVWIVGCINAFNLIDGIDGLASGLGIIASITVGILLYTNGMRIEALILFYMAAACLGFLKYNFHPARIFLGDTGSMFIGFVFAIISIISISKIYTFSAVIIPILAAGIPLFDTVLAIWRRAAKKILHYVDNKGTRLVCKITNADREHLHHRLLRKTLSQIKTTVILYLLAIALALISLLFILLENVQQGILFTLVIVALLTGAKKLSNVELWYSTKLVVAGIGKIKNNFLLTMLTQCIDVVLIVSAYAFIYYVFFDWSIRLDTASYNDLFKLMYLILPIIIILNLSRVYKIVWSKPSTDNYIYLVKILIAGFCVSTFLGYMHGSFSSLRMFAAENFIFYLLAFILVVGWRLLLLHFRITFIKNVFLAFHPEKDKMLKTLIYGAGANCSYYLTVLYSNLEKELCHVVGIIDNDKNLKGNFVYGHKVLGTVLNIDDLYKKNRFEQMIITDQELDESTSNKIEQFCLKHKIIVKKFKVELMQ